jgi:hypothetical protein
MDNRKKLRLFIGLLLIIGGIGFGIFQKNTQLDSLILINVGIVVLVITLIRYLRYGKNIETDELSKKISYISLAASYQLILYLIILAWWLVYWQIINIQLKDLLAVFMFLMLFLPYLLKWIYSHKIESL